MKNVLIGIFLLATIGLGYIVVRSKVRLSLEGLEGKTARLVRGDLTLPINATGSITPARRLELKAEASGEVIEIVRQAGERVRAGDELIRLQPDEEERSVARAKLEQDIAEARLQTARVKLEQTRTVDVATAESNLRQLQETLRYTEFRAKKYERLSEDTYNAEERLQSDSAYRAQLAEVDAAKAAVERAKLLITQVEQDVKQAEATFETARNNLLDAQKRLLKTKIVSPINAIIADIRVVKGEVIQGGKTTLTGGTILAVVLDVEKLRVKAEVDEADIGRVLAIAPQWARPGNEGEAVRPADLVQAAESLQHRPTITVETFRDREFGGVIERVYPEPKSAQGVITYLVDVLITSPDRDELLPGMRADVTFTSEHVADALLCPNEAIHEGARGELGVHVPKPGSTPTERLTEFVPCRFGLDNGNYSEVLCDALKEGMTVYTKLPAERDRERSRKQ